ncbi:MAG: HAMP domain-containing histidine kinase [Clostridiales bacterium]|nr:HAMP domain-containing histidine kinase [Clostridiales bacterium]
MIRKLNVKLILCALLSLLLAGGSFLLARYCGEKIIDDQIYSRKTVMSHEKAVFADFIAYVNKNAKGDITAFETNDRFFGDKKNLIVAVYNAGRHFTGTQTATLLYSSLQDPASVYEVLQSEYQDYWYTCPVSSNGDLSRSKIVRVMYFPMYSAKRILMFASSVGAFAVFAVCFLLLVGHKTRYISRLSAQLNSMAGGELEVPITVKGTDEIGMLAENMELMRQSFVERLKEEEDMKTSQSELMRDMSHDLRTPLTALTGYLEILNRKIDDETDKEYAENALKRAYQIKEMTDDMFEYFLVYGKDAGLSNARELDAVMCLSQLWDEEAAELEAAGFETQSIPSENEISLNIDVNLMRRVMDNISSNIVKYADKAQPVIQKTEVREGRLFFEVTNHVSDRPANTNSSGIGLKSCRKIASLHGGSFETEETDGCFTARLTLGKAK